MKIGFWNISEYPAIGKNWSWKKLEILVKTSNFEISSVHNILQHLATAGEMNHGTNQTKEGYRGQKPVSKNLLLRIV